MKIELGIFFEAMFHFFNKLQLSIYDVLSTAESKDKSHSPPEELVVPGSRSLAVNSKKEVLGCVWLQADRLVCYSVFIESLCARYQHEGHSSE